MSHGLMDGAFDAAMSPYATPAHLDAPAELFDLLFLLVLIKIKLCCSVYVSE